MLPNTPFNRVAREDMAAHHQISWDRSMELHGDTTFVEVMANAPHAYDWYSRDFYHKLFYSSRVDRKIVELVRFKLANVHGCASCNRGDRLASLDAGLSAEQLDSIDDFEKGPFSEREKVALAFAEVMVLTNPLGVVAPVLYARARQVFSDGDLLEKEPFCPFKANTE